MRRQHRFTPFVACVAAWSTACSTLTQNDLAKRTDYVPAMAAHGGGDSATAAALLPDKEADGFITTLERGWLDLLAGKPNPAPLVRIGNVLEERKTLSVRRETKSYFYKETEEGYFPAEHEAILLHIVAGLSFAAKGQQAEARIEARKASLYLQGEFGSGYGFDDPALRLWLAGLWTAAGEWSSARVDLRAASKLAGKQGAALAALADSPTPPSTLSLVFVGPGPDVAWNPSLDDRLDGIVFKPSAAATSIQFQGGAEGVSLPTAPWYARHQERDNEIRQVLNKSRYMAEGMPSAGAAAATMSVGAIFGSALMVLSVGLGLGIAYAGFRIGFSVPSEVGVYAILGGGFAGLTVATFGVKGGMHMIETSSDASQRLIEQGFSPIEAYRYVRFLPDHVYLATGSGAVLDGARQELLRPFLSLGATEGGADPKVDFYFMAGTELEQTVSSRSTPWFDQHGNSWILLARPLTALAAEAACETLNGPKADVNFRRPTWEEMLDARQGGMFDERRSPLATRLKRGGDMWTTSRDGKDLKGKCRFLVTADFSEMPTGDCATPRAVVCVGIRPKKKSPL